MERTKRSYPITSYGIILFVQRKDEDFKIDQTKIQFLLYQRRDTYEYIEFVRGMWETMEDVKRFFSLMSAEERKRLANYTFDELWDDFWVRHSSGSKDCTLSRPRNKYAQIKPFIPTILKETTAKCDEAPWGFPKGRKNSGENQIQCAIREFEEETHINKDDIYVWNQSPLAENFIGSDGRPYVTVYYIAEYKPEAAPLTQDECKLPPLIETPKGIRKYTASNEAFRIGWYSFDEAQKKLSTFRQEILLQASRYVAEYVGNKSLTP